MPPESILSPRRDPRCPMCGDAPQAPFKPFCSRGCRDRDLIGWMDEGYRIPARPPVDEGDAPDGSEGD
ncbi:MAG: DNA gyrase inhibitor YacG [Sphingobium sp.]|nr:DNA gyrase inhibitor YacG [Sphingobium sp.]